MRRLNVTELNFGSGMIHVKEMGRAKPRRNIRSRGDRSRASRTDRNLRVSLTTRRFSHHSGPAIRRALAIPATDILDTVQGRYREKSLNAMPAASTPIVIGYRLVTFY